MIDSCNDNLLSLLTTQSFISAEWKEEKIADYQLMASVNANTDNSIAVLTDYSTNESYIYVGKFGLQLGLQLGNNYIESAFEEIIFKKILNEDLVARNELERQYYNFIKSLPTNDRRKYNTSCILRLHSHNGNNVTVSHKTFFLESFSNGSIWLALCLYSPSINELSGTSIMGKIIDNETGTIVYDMDNEIISSDFVLSSRELDVLQLIAKGYDSKSTADQLHISVYTVHRHRQNILKKMNVKNTAEAIQKANFQRILSK